MNAPAPRYDIELSVRLVPTESEEGGFQGTSQNLSETGVLVRADRMEPMGSFLRLKFPVFEGTGEVIWTRETDEELGVFLGMKFASLSPQDRQALLRLLEGSAEP